MSGFEVVHINMGVGYETPMNLEKSFTGLGLNVIFAIL